MGYNGLQLVTMGYSRLQWVTVGYNGLQQEFIIYNIKEECQTVNIACTNTLSKIRLLKVLIQLAHLLVEGKC